MIESCRWPGIFRHDDLAGDETPADRLMMGIRLGPGSGAQVHPGCNRGFAQSWVFGIFVARGWPLRLAWLIRISLREVCAAGFDGSFKH